MGTLWMIVRRSLRQHALSTAVTVVSVALAAGLVMSVFAVSKQTRDAFTGGEIGYDAVLGARGSPLQLVLNTVYHLETSPGNIPWSLYQSIKNERGVTAAVPYAVGDNYRGWRIVGTTEQAFAEQQFAATNPGGRSFDERYPEAVIGAEVARKAGLTVGSKFSPYHGLIFKESEKHADVYTVVGVLEPTNSPSDRVIWIPIEGIFRMEGHVLRGTGEVYEPATGASIPDEHKEVSAVMLRLGGRTGVRLDQTINRQGTVATLAYPIEKSMAELFEKMGWVVKVLELVAYLVVVVAAGAILASLYNTMNERRREFAILRALGARKGTVFAAIVLESSTIALLGSLVGYVIYAAILGTAAAVVRSQTGVVMEVTDVHPALWWTPAGMMVVGAIAGLLPAFKAYSTDVAASLVPGS